MAGLLAFLAAKVSQLLFMPGPSHSHCALCSPLVLSSLAQLLPLSPPLPRRSTFCSSGTASQGGSWIINTHKTQNHYSVSVCAVSIYADYPSISRDPERATGVYAINILWKEEKFPPEAFNYSAVPQPAPVSAALWGFVQFSDLPRF